MDYVSARDVRGDSSSQWLMADGSGLWLIADVLSSMAEG